MPQMPWSDDRIERFKALFYQRLSFAEIAAAMGDGLTRNACIGKAARLGLTRAGAPPKPRPPRPSSAKPAYVARKRFRKPDAPKLPDWKAAEVKDELRDLPADESPYAVGMLELQEHHCRWPLGEPSAQMLYCGDTKVTGRPYCIRHCRLAYNVTYQNPNKHLPEFRDARRAA